MRIAQHAERLVLVVDGGILDVDAASGGQFGPDPQAVFEHWDEFQAWASTVSGPTQPLDPEALGPPVPRPRQVFAIGMKLRRARRRGRRRPADLPPTFTKFPTCLTGPGATVAPSSNSVDWEVELVVVISRHRHHVAENDARRHVAGLRRPGPLRPPRPAASPGPAVQPGEVVPRVRPDWAVAGDPRRARRSRRPAHRLHPERPADAREPHQRPDLRGADAHPPAHVHHPAAAR